MCTHSNNILYYATNDDLISIIDLCLSEYCAVCDIYIYVHIFMRKIVYYAHISAAYARI